MLWCEDLRGLITSIRGFIALAMATKERLPPTSLWTLSAHPRITQYLQLTLIMWT